ncbi:MAG TPA: CsgG/HfaB family protein [Candidatus Binatia bacterium]|nr:CsgG/HfaB family protein [Candidatus Binatia bacterium]
MKNILLITASLLLACASSQGALTTVAVFDFASPDESVKDLGAKLSTLLTAHLSSESHIIMVERAEFEKLLGEQELGLSGTVTSATAAKVGQLTGAKVLVTGRVFKADKALIAVAKIIGTETSRVYGETAKGPAAETSVNDLAQDLAGRIAKLVKAHRDSLLAPDDDRAQRLQKVIKGLKGPRHPIAVRVHEEHFGRRATDPAVQTELSLILQQAGFTIVDEKSDARPEIEITGEAFSAAGVRKANLISCKARVELKAQRRQGGKIIAIDRQTSVAVDTTEQTAAKSALQAAAAELAERLLPKLAL